eukprot:TRINITY_DN4912_c0_g1_i1.p1 TRINITY_DN4912_c0_g1~~TRINITY_DN4912_c0_g1_i1.p1  ORF type:complete len:626 (+),score=256.73 TRINITY_DN4912_c0_g1_i1:73-1950(+)
MTTNNEKTLETLNFNNLAIKELPTDTTFNENQRTTPGVCFCRVNPTHVKTPSLVAFSEDTLKLLDLQISETTRPEFILYFSGNLILPGSEPSAHCYCGHQFGYFSGQLGDGATMYLGEIINQKGVRWEIQFKGAGKTPYSRTADGRKVLRSSLREFLCSEANFYLGIPTTRAGTIVTSDSYTERDIFYTGNIIQERCTIISRVAPTFLRFGSFEICKSKDKESGRTGPSAGFADKIIPILANYTIKNFYPEIWSKHVNDTTDFNNIESLQNCYKEFFTEIVTRTAKLVAHWQTIGFCHGVLNTDNMSIVGVTIDYGPFGFMENFDPNYICNGSDNGGRYSYKEQPTICQWNCQKLAEALGPILPLSITQPIFITFMQQYENYFHTFMLQKLGLTSINIENDKKLISDLFILMEKISIDFTNFFRNLSKFEITQINEINQLSVENQSLIDYFISQCASIELLKSKCKPSIPREKLAQLISIARSQPEFLSLLGVSPELILSEMRKTENFQKMAQLTTEQQLVTNRNLLINWLNQYKIRLFEEFENSKLSIEQFQLNKIKMMNSVNPKFILRNWVAQNAIKAAEKGDYNLTIETLQVLKVPFDEGEEAIQQKFANETPNWAQDICVT